MISHLALINDFHQSATVLDMCDVSTRLQREIVNIHVKLLNLLYSQILIQIPVQRSSMMRCVKSLFRFGCVGSLLRLGQGIHWQSLKAKRETIRILMISRLAVMTHERSSTYNIYSRFPPIIKPGPVLRIQVTYLKSKEIIEHTHRTNRVCGLWACQWRPGQGESHDGYNGGSSKNEYSGNFGEKHVLNNSL